MNMKKFIKNSMKKFQKDERGMTLVELLAVVVILAIVGIIAFIAIGNVIENSKKDAHVANAQQLISAAKLWEATNGDFPSNGLSSDDGGFNEVEKLVNPWVKSDTGYKGTVKKVIKGSEGSEDSNVYEVTMTGTDTKCEITDVEEKDINEGRKKVCP